VLDTATSAAPRPSVATDVTAIVPVRNAAHWVADCLTAIAQSGVRDIIVVDGNSTDDTVELASRLGARVVSDGGRGLPAARRLGAETATSRLVALIDVDVRLHEGALARLLDEFVDGDYTALQAGLHSIGGPGYWSRALAWHHRTGRSRAWFGLVATIFDRAALLDHDFDERFSSGEDIDLRWRLERAGERTGVSEQVVVDHLFGDGFAFARGQWLADGAGHGRMAAAHGGRAWMLVGVPLAASVRGVGLSLFRRQPRWIPYFVCFLAYNYVGMAEGLLESWRTRAASRPPR
jgi:glycosyltransferase involved in cell wall biosynthesis